MRKSVLTWLTLVLSLLVFGLVVAAIPGWFLVMIGALFGGQYLEGWRILIAASLLILLPLGAPVQGWIVLQVWRGRRAILPALALGAVLFTYAASVYAYTVELLGAELALAIELERWGRGLVLDVAIPGIIPAPSGPLTTPSAAIGLVLLNLVVQFLSHRSINRG